MSTGSGLDSQIMFGQETTWGTGVTPTRSIEYNSETIKYDPTWLEPTALHTGIKYKRAPRASISRTSVSGDFMFDVNTLGMGMLIRNMLGSTTATTTLISGSAYKQIHVPGDFRSLGLTVQVGRPEPGTGTRVPFTYDGCKIVKWAFSLKDNATPNLQLSVDGQGETTATALATPAFLSGSTTYNFSQASLKLGGTASTSAGETTIAGGTPIAAIATDISLSGSVPMATSRFGLGNAGQKNEQLENGIPTITGKLSTEFAKTELYTPFQAGTAMCLQLDLVGATLGATTYLFSIIIPAIKIKAAPPNVSGPDLVQMSTDFEVYSNEVDPVIQFKIQSTEATVV
jgi:hypothetical protein